MKQPIVQRRGVVLVAALVCLLIVMTILGSTLLATLRSARQLHLERDLRQCELLFVAGMDRAAFRLTNEMDYRGETWKLPAPAIVGSGDGLVTIEVSRGPGGDSPQVTVVAEYPTGSELSIRRSRTFQVPSKISQPEE
jgi:hypothetical protein